MTLSVRTANRDSILSSTPVWPFVPCRVIPRRC
nr:MAG TPA: hypothetical protein [Caudoviricetes sp.]